MPAATIETGNDNVPYLFQSAALRYLPGMTRNWTPRDALIDVLMEHLYVWAPGETEARRVIESMADQMLQTMDEAGYAFVTVKAKKANSRPAEQDAGRPH